MNTITIICSGCSFTHGLELWEEKFVPNYSKCEDMEEVNRILYEHPFTHNKDLVQRDLTYSGTVKRMVECEVINIGKNGSSQLDTCIRTMNMLMKIKRANPDKKVICITQDTSPYRMYLWHGRKMGNSSGVLSLLEHEEFDNKRDGYEIKNVYMKYMPDELLQSEYYLQSLSIQNYCINNGIGYLHFSMKHDQGQQVVNKSLDTSKLVEAFYDSRYAITTPMIDRLEQHFGDKSSFYLPSYHVNIASHKLMGEWIVEELKERKLI